MSLFETVSTLTDKGVPTALVTVVRKDGSTPRQVGGRMVVTEADTFGTIGGGIVEGLAIEAARNVLDGTEEPGIRTYELKPDGNTGMHCGGEMDVFIDRVRDTPRLYIAGGGHIGQELALMASRLDYDVTVIDDREEVANSSDLPADVTVVNEQYGDAFETLPITRETAVAVATRSSAFDTQAIAGAIDGGAGYIGVVASENKSEHIIDSLQEEGYSRAEMTTLRAPVGLDLGGETPGDIALSILAEINRHRYGTSGNSSSRTALDDLVVVRGGGDLGTGVVYRLHQAGFPVIVTEVAQPKVVRRAVAFASAVDDDTVTVEDVTARLATDRDEAVTILDDGDVPVIVDPDADIAAELGAAVLVDAIMAKGKQDTGTSRQDADVVVGMGPGFEAGEDVDAVVETHRGHELGRVIYDGTAEPYDGVPGERKGYTHERVLRAPVAGRWQSASEIGALASAGDVVGHVDDEPVETEIDGLVRGLIADGTDVSEGEKIGDVDPRGESVDPAKISDKALGVGGAVLEAVLRLR